MFNLQIFLSKHTRNIKYLIGTVNISTGRTQFFILVTTLKSALQSTMQLVEK